MQRSGSLKRKTPLTSRTGLTRSAPKRRKRRPTGFSPEVREQVRRRACFRCEATTSACTGKLEEIHHRKLRRHGDHRLQNSLGVCRACHRFIHDNPTVSYIMGHLVHEYDDPADIPVRRGDGHP